MLLSRTCFVAAVLMLSVNAQAQKPQTETILQLFEVSNSRKIVETMYEQSRTNIHNLILNQDDWPDDFSDAQKLDVANNVADMTENYLREHMSWTVVSPVFIELYQKYFTEKELQDSIAFYRTESGKSMNDKLPAMMAEATSSIMQLSAKLGSDIEKMIGEYLSTVK